MGLIERLAGKVIRRGELTITFPNGVTRTFGAPEPGGRKAAVHVRDATTLRRILRNPRLGVGEAYMDGGLTVDTDIYDFLELVTFNTRWERGGGARHAIRKRARWRGKLDQFNWRARSKRNVAHHYDIGNRQSRCALRWRRRGRRGSQPPSAKNGSSKMLKS